MRTRPDDRQSIGASGVVATPVPASSLDGKTAMIFRLRRAKTRFLLLLTAAALSTHSASARFAKASKPLKELLGAAKLRFARTVLAATVP